MTNLAPIPQSKPPITIGGIVMIIIGAFLLLFPGGCSLYFLSLAVPEWFQTNRPFRSDPSMALLYVPMALGFIAALLGLWMIVAGRKRRRVIS